MIAAGHAESTSSNANSGTRKPSSAGRRSSAASDTAGPGERWSTAEISRSMYIAASTIATAPTTDHPQPRRKTPARIRNSPANEVESGTASAMMPVVMITVASAGRPRAMPPSSANSPVEVRRSTTEVDDAVKVLVELPRARISDTVTHVGPPVKSREHAERFRKTWTDHPDARSPVYEEDGRLKVERLREYRRADQLLRAKLLEYDLGKHLNEALGRGYEVLWGVDVVQEDTARLLTMHLSRKKSWEI